MTNEIPRIRDVYREYELGRISFDQVIAASERIIAQYEMQDKEKARANGDGSGVADL